MASTLNDIGTDHSIYTLVLRPPKYEWFGLQDLVTRFALSILHFYYLLFTRPITFLKYTYNYNCIFYYKLPGALLTLCYPALPFVLCVVEIFKRVWDMFHTNWMNAGPGAIFFTKPKGFVNALIWDFWLNVGMYTSGYLMAADNSEGTDHMWYDSVLNKDFWRDLFERCDARVPREMFRWKDNKLTVNYPLEGKKLVVKMIDSYLGIGDNIWHQGKEFTTESELEELMRKTYGDKETVGTEFVVAAKRFGVHQGDVMTVRRNAQDPPRVFRILYWGDCTGETSHSAQSVYHVDADTETITDIANWYSPTYLGQPTNLIGEKVPGTQVVCKKAMEMHGKITQPWVAAIGWDYMHMEDGECVFFEGNFACSRLRRHMFSSLAACWEVTQFFAPLPFTFALNTGLAALLTSPMR